MLDGLYQMNGRRHPGDRLGVRLAVPVEQEDGQCKKLATGFKGPADFCVVPNKKGLLVAVPDLVKGEIRFVQLGK